MLFVLAGIYAAPAQAYQERTAVKTASVCAGVLESLMLVVVLTIPADTPEETRNEVVDFYSSQFDAVASFVEAHQAAAGVANTEIGTLIDRGRAYLQAIYESVTPPPLEAIATASQPCNDLAAALRMKASASIDAAFAAATVHHRPLLTD